MDIKDPTQSPPELLDYDNYRAYLKAWYQFSKEGDPKISFRYLSKRTGLRSPNYWKLIMEGERCLSVDMIPRFADTLKLSPTHQLYFHHLVLMNQANVLKEKSIHAQRILELRRRLLPLTVGKISDPLYYRHWYNPVLRELAPLLGKDCTPERLQSSLLREIPITEIRSSLEFLCGSGFLVKTEEGAYAQRESLLSSGDRASHILAYTCLQKLHQLGIEALDTVSEKDREFGSLTLSVDPASYEKIKSLVRRFRKEALEIASQSERSHPHHIVQVNIQVFPLSKSIEVPK